jgi:dihydropyrimidinase
VFSRGVPVVTDREYTGHAGHGVYTPRSTCQYLT